jgi:hypothetical protein
MEPDSPNQNASDKKPLENEKEQKEEGSLSAARKTFITTLVAICLNPVSAAVGYYMNHILQKPRLQIEYVSENYFVENHKISAKILGELQKDQRLKASLRESLMRVQQQGDPDCLSWLDGADWSDECIDRVESVAAGIMNTTTVEVEALQSNIDALKDWTPPAPLNLIPNGTVQYELLTIQAQKDKQGAINMLQRPSEVLSREVSALKDLAGIFPSMRQSETPRTGDLELVVGVLNSGDSDGVIANRATLTFEGKELWLHPKPDDTWTPIKAHAFQEIRFAVGESEQDLELLKEWKAAIVAGKKIDISVTLKTGANTNGPTSAKTLDPAS